MNLKILHCMISNIKSIKKGSVIINSKLNKRKELGLNVKMKKVEYFSLYSHQFFLTAVQRQILLNHLI